MKQLGRMLFITEPDVTLTVRGGSFEAVKMGDVVAHIPIHNLDGIVSYAYTPATPAAMAKCAEKTIAFNAVSQSGRLRYRVCGSMSGNAQLRRSQYSLLGSQKFRMELSKSVLRGKISNEIEVLRQFCQRNPGKRTEQLRNAEKVLYVCLKRLRMETEEERIRGVEGLAAKMYFGVLGHMILSGDESMQFNGRSRRPPRSPCNALLSLAYMTQTTEYTHALECMGLDPYAVLFHHERSGKPAFALDLQEETRPAADRFVIRLINLGIIRGEMFEYGEDGVFLNTCGLKLFYKEWSKAREKQLVVPGIDGKVEQGLLPFVQAKRLADVIAGRTAEYTPFLFRERRCYL